MLREGRSDTKTKLKEEGREKTDLVRSESLKKSEKKRLDRFEGRRDSGDESESLRRSSLKSRRILEFSHLEDLLDKRESAREGSWTVEIDEAFVDAEMTRRKD